MEVLRPVQRGERIADIESEAALHTFQTGNEVALVRLESGGGYRGRALVTGGPGGIDPMPGVIRIFGHTHPPTAAGGFPSPTDVTALEALGQRSSHIRYRGQRYRFSRE